jgi:hypothetical protein
MNRNTFDNDDNQDSGRGTILPKPAQIPCLRCGHHQTWAETRRQFGRLLRFGYSKEGAKDHSPRCQKCTTRFLAGCRDMNEEQSDRTVEAVEGIGSEITNATRERISRLASEHREERRRRRFARLAAEGAAEQAGDGLPSLD